MDVIFEKARKAAGISDMSKNYPAEFKERARASTWNKFLGALQVSVGDLRDEISKLQAEILRLEKDGRKVDRKLAAAGMELVAHEHGLSKDQRSQALARISN